MKKKPMISGKMIIAVLTIVSVTATLVTASFARTEPDKITEPVSKSKVVQRNAEMVDRTEENTLVAQLIKDGLVNQFKGFMVERQKDKLFINGKEQTTITAKKYLRFLSKEVMRIQVSSFSDRQLQHPEASFMQLLVPTTFSSPFVNYSFEAGC